MSNNWKSPEMKVLFKAILLLKNEDEVSSFLRDLCTISELNEMAKRFTAVQMINNGESIREISKKTGLSTTTVSRVSQWKKSIGEGGYNLVLDRLEKKAKTLQH